MTRFTSNNRFNQIIVLKIKKLLFQISTTTITTQITKSTPINIMTERGRRSPMHDCVIKLMLTGTSAVGKSAILLRYCDNSFSPHYITTIGIDFKVKTLDIDGKRIKVQIWDTAGQERFKSLTNAYYKGAHGIILVYAIDDEESFNDVRGWMRSIDLHAAPNVCRFVVANKNDLEDRRQISKSSGKELAKEYGAPFFQVSARTGEGIDDMFTKITLDVKKKLFPTPIATAQNNGDNQQIDVDNPTAGNKAGGCC